MATQSSKFDATQCDNDKSVLRCTPAITYAPSGEPVNGVVVATSAAAVESWSFDCIVCESQGRPFTNTMRGKTSCGRDDVAVNDRCSECLEIAPKYSVYFECESKPSGCRGTTCGRRVCLKCVGRSRHTRKYSRFHHNEPQWKTPLFACDASMARACLCYYDWVSCLTAYQPITADEHAFGDFGCDWALRVIGSPLSCFLLASDFLCVSLPSVNAHEHQLRQRFGLEPASCSEQMFCRWCVVARGYREAEARGYPQECLCGSRAERRPSLLALPTGPQLQAKKCVAQFHHGTAMMS